MKYLDRLINFIFSLLILVLSVIVIMVSTGFMGYTNVDTFIKENIFSTENNTTTCIVAIAIFLAALKTTVFLSKTKKPKKATIMVDTSHGKVQIAQDTIENTAKNAAKEYDEVKDVQVRIVKERKGINVYIVLLVLPNTNIIELSSKVQDTVKNAIESTTSVTVYNVDIKIKNITDTRKFKNKDKIEPKVEKIETVEPLENVSEIKNAEVVENSEETAKIDEEITSESDEGSNELAN